MKINLVKKPDIVFGQKFYRDWSKNNIKIENAINENDEYMSKHQTTQQNAHNTAQILHRLSASELTLEQFLQLMNARTSNLVLGATTDQSVELKDARVDLESESHTTLYDRLLSDFLRLQNTDSDLGVRSVKNTNLIGNFANQAGVAIKKINKDKTHSIAIASNSTTAVKLRTANTVAKDFIFGWEKPAYQVPIKNKFLLQGIYDDDNSDYTYYSYSQNDLMWIERFDNFNNYIDRMHLPLGGHATDFFVTTENGIDYVWNQVGEQTQNGIKNHFCKIKYAAKTVNYGDAEIVAEFDVFQNYKADANLDAEKDIISIIFNRGNDFLIENRKFSEWQKGVNNVLGSFIVSKKEYHAVHQSIDVLDNMIFWHYGETRRDINATGKHGVVVFTLDGKRISSYEIDVTKLISNDAIDGYYEPEGFTAKRTDVPNVYELCFGFATSGKTTYKSWRSSIHAVATPDFNDEFQIELKSENGLQKQTFTLPEKITSDRLLVDTNEPFNFAKLEKSADFTGYEQRHLSEIDVIKLIKQYTNKTDYETVLFRGNAGVTGAKIDIAGNFKDYDEIKVLYNTSVANHAVQTYASLDRSANILVLNTVNADDAITGVSQIRECTIDISAGTSFVIKQQIVTELSTNTTNFKAEEFRIMKITGINKV
ncbi:phage baseplate protein [Brochothrix thermosphacta]|uniref:phage baseplate protein n=1 Tax=Brochothrix thermosphacta TaxID=2756 RepID=UPI000D78D8C4|nr:hypothetical protein [Brochothrix thermosphacta]SPN76596.1 hypothetical protein BTEBP_80066 [Brochothrix thermosphacta]